MDNRLFFNKSDLYLTIKSLWSGRKFKNNALCEEYKHQHSFLNNFTCLATLLLLIIKLVYFIIVTIQHMDQRALNITIVIVFIIVLFVLLVVTILFYSTSKCSIIKFNLNVLVFYTDITISIAIEQLAFHILFPSNYEESLTNIQISDYILKLHNLRLRVIYLKIISGGVSYFSIYGISFFKVLIHSVIYVLSVLLAIMINDLENKTSYVFEIVLIPFVFYGFLFFQSTIDDIIRKSFVINKIN